MKPDFYNRYNDTITKMFQRYANIPIFGVSGISSDGIQSMGAYLSHGQSKIMQRKMAVRVAERNELFEAYELQNGLVGGIKRPHILSRTLKSQYSQKFAPMLRDMIRYNNFEKGMAAFRFIGAPLIGLTIGTLAAEGIGMYFRTMVKATDYINDVVNHSRSLELGGYMGPGFMTQEAATERQRMMSELRNSPNSNRRFLGSEASIYSGLV